MKISCPKKSLVISFFSLIILAFFLSKISFNNQIKASVTSTTPVADFPEVDGKVYATAVSEDGKTLYIGGDFSSVEDAEDEYDRYNLAAINLDTMLVTD